jgi:lysophospholipase L1-like esterase
VAPAGLWVMVLDAEREVGPASPPWEPHEVGGTRRSAWTRQAWIRRCWWVLPAVLAFAAMFLALLLTPPVSVSTFGQTVQVGAVRPPASLGWSGPGQAELFGEGPVPTVQSFDGFVRPLIVWQRFNRDAGASQFIQSASADPRSDVRTGIGEVGQSLAAGWQRYVVRLVVIAGVLGLGLHLVTVGVGTVVRGTVGGIGRRRYLAALLVTALLSSAVTAALTALSLASASRELRGVTSLADLLGTERLAPVPVTIGRATHGVEAAVIGDSTAAGDGNRPVSHADPQDSACHRSRDAYAAALRSATGSTVSNLACSSATIAEGLLGPQSADGLTLPPQVGVLKGLPSARAVVVSIGANDVGWEDFLRYCYISTPCNDTLSGQLFRSRLDRFKIQYAQLLQQLADLPGRPLVIINQYYDPFGASLDCLPAPARTSTTGGSTQPAPGSATPTPTGQAPGPAGKVQTLRSELEALNAVLAEGANAFHDAVVHPDFGGHGLCSPQPWVQDLHAPAPFHPNAAGQLAIASADIPYLVRAATTPLAPTDGTARPLAGLATGASGGATGRG